MLCSGSPEPLFFTLREAPRMPAWLWFLYWIQVPLSFFSTTKGHSMKNSRRSLFAVALSVALAFCAPLANAAPEKAREAAAFCSSLKNVATMAVDEALSVPDLDIVNTEIFKEVMNAPDGRDEAEVYMLAMATAWAVIRKDGTREEAGEVVRTSCLKGLS